MLNKIIAFSIQNKLIVALFIAAWVSYGVYETTKLPIDAVPDITNNQVQVITIAPSFGATDIERLITFPIEQANNNIQGMKEIRSFSRFGLSLVTIVFDDETDIYWARQQVAERLQKVQNEIPKGIGVPELGPVSTGLGEIYQYVIRPQKGYEKRYDATELRTIQDWIVRRQLLGVKGVAEVSSFGGKLKQYEIAIQPNKLQSYGITINDVFNAVEKNNGNTGGAYIEKGATALFIRSEGLISRVEDIENILIERQGAPLFIRDVAEVRIGHAIRYGAMCYNDQGEVSGAVVMMLKGANSSEVIRLVKERVVQIQKTLPEGVVIEPFLDRSKMVGNAIGTVEKNLLEGALIVIFVLVLFLGNLRAGLIVASVIPLAMLFAVILMNFFGVSGNLMSLGALDFGLIVDGAVIIVEATMHQLIHSRKFGNIVRITQEEMDEEVKSSASKMMNSAVFGQAIILIVYLPIFTLQGIEGKMFKPMAQTVAFALLGAFILSVTYIPMMSALCLSKNTKHQPNISDKMMAYIEKKYATFLANIIIYPKTILALVFGMFFLSLLVLFNLGGEFIPALEEGDFAVETRVLTGSNLKTTIESTQRAAKILKEQFPEVEMVVTKIGSGEVPTDPMPMEASDIIVILKDKELWTSASTFNELSEKMSGALDAVPGITVGFQYPVQMRFNELMTGARQDVVCKIFGEDLDTLAVYAEKLGKLVNTVEGAQNLFIEPITGMPQIVIEYNRANIAQYQLTISDINRAVNTAFAGQSTGLVFEGEKRFDLMVRLAGMQRDQLEDVQNLLIPTPLGTQIPLAQLANVSIKNGPNQIQREDAKRRIVAGFNIRNRDVQSIVNQLKDKVEKKIKFPAGYYITYGGAFENLHQAKQRLMIAVPISLILIFILLFFAFNSVRQGLLIYSAIPFSAIGGILFLAWRGMPFSISAGIGFIALFGVAVLNGIVLIAEFNQLKKEGLTDLKQIVMKGTVLRLRPILMTALVASLGFLPMAISQGPGAEVQRPLATVVIGGLLLATFLTLCVLPILYMLFEKSQTRAAHSLKAGLCAIIIFFIVVPLNAQKRIDLNTAIDKAIKHNEGLQNEQLKVAFQKKIIKTAQTIEPTNFALEVGQVNSALFDSKFVVSQTLNLPVIYSNQKKVLQEESKSAMLNYTLKEVDLKKLVTQTFYALVYMYEKQKLLKRSDSLYQEFLKKSNLRLKKGESNILEKSTAEAQRGNIFLQLLQIKQDIQSATTQLQILVNEEVFFEPFYTQVKMNYVVSYDTAVVTAHPNLRWLEQQKTISLANTRMERSRLLPSYTFGYANNSFSGVGPDNMTYRGSDRFHAFNLGLGIPLLGGAQKAKWNASKLAENIAENDYQLQKKSMIKQYQTCLSHYEHNLQKINYFEESALINANLIEETANRQFQEGEISYLDWVMLINQSIGIRNNYIDALMAYNEVIIQLNYLQQK